MVLAFAMSLAGLNPEEFSGIIAKLTPASKPRVVTEDAGRSISPSTRSESSGIGSSAPSSVGSTSVRSTMEGSSSPWPTPSSSRAPSLRSSEGNSPWLTPSSSTAPSVRSNDGGSTPSLTPISSRPATPSEHSSNNETTVDATTPLDVAKLRRDVLNLAANIREPGWQVIKPPMTRNDPFSYVRSNKIVNRLEEFHLKEDYPMRYCEKCGFGQPSPYLV